MRRFVCSANATHWTRSQQKSYNDKRKNSKDGQPWSRKLKTKAKRQKKTKPEETASAALDTSAALLKKKKKAETIPFKKKNRSHYAIRQQFTKESVTGIDHKVIGIQILREVTGCRYVLSIDHVQGDPLRHLPCAGDRGCKGNGISRYAMKNTRTRTALADELLHVCH